MFTTEERPLLTGLPQVAYEISRWVYGRRVGRNGHVVWEKNFYSVPVTHIGTSVDLRITDRVLQIYSGQQRISSHLLLPEGSANQYRTNDADLPAGEHYQPWDAPRVREWADRVGPSAMVVVNRIFESVAVDEQGLNAALAVLRLTRRYSAERVEDACKLALAGHVRSPRYVHLHPILATGQDQAARQRPPREEPVEEGGFVRGAEDENLVMGMGVEERLHLIVDEAYATFTHGKVDGLIRRAGLRYPAADLLRIDLVEQRGLDRNLLASLATCGFIERHQNVVFQGVTGSGKSYLGCAVAKQACQHRYRAHYIRMPDLEEAWATARDKPQGTTKFLKKYAAFTVLVIDEWLLDHPDEAMRSMLLELLERRYDKRVTPPAGGGACLTTSASCGCRDLNNSWNDQNET